MLRLLASALREDPQPQQEPPASPEVTAEQSLPEPPRSPRLQVEHARRLEESVAILRAELADARKEHEKRLAEAEAQHAAKLASQRDKYESRTQRLEARNTWLEETLAQLTNEKTWLARRNEALESTEKKLDARIGTLEERVFELQTENWALKQENADFRVDFDGVVGEMAAFRKGAEALAERAHKALTRPKAKDVRGQSNADEEERGRRKGRGQGRRGEDEDGEEEEDGAQATPKGNRIEAPDSSLSGETLRTAPRSKDGNGGEGRSRISQASGGVDPRSLEALRTLGASRNVSPSPTPDRARHKRLGGSNTISVSGAGSVVADSATEHVAIRPSRKRQRTESDTEPGLNV